MRAKAWLFPPDMIMILCVGRLPPILGRSDIRQRVVFHQLVPHTDLPQLLSAGDIGVWPGDPSMGIQEAMAGRAPAILPEYIVEGQTSNHLLANDSRLSVGREDRC